MAFDNAEAEFYAVSCAAHPTTCSEFKIKGTPTVFHFPRDSDEGMPIQGRVTVDTVAKILNAGHNINNNNNDNDNDENQTNKRDEEPENFGNVVEEEEEDSRVVLLDRQDEITKGQLLEDDDDDDKPIDETTDKKFSEDQTPEYDDDDNGRQNEDEKKYGDTYSDENDNKEDDDAQDDDRPGNNHMDSEDQEEDPWFPKEIEQVQQQQKAVPIGFNSLVGSQQNVRPGAIAARTATRARLSQQTDPRVEEAIRAQFLKAKGKPTGFFRGGRKDGFNVKDEVPNEGATNTMKAHTAKTREYDERRKQILERIEKRKGKAVRAQVEKRWDDMNQKKNQGVLSDSPKKNLPYKKILTKPRVAERIPLVKRAFKMSDEEALMLDTTLAFLHGLQYGLFRNGPTLGESEHYVLGDWLQLLSISLPQEWGIHEAIDDLMMRKDYISRSRDNLLSVIKNHMPQRATFSPSCGGRGGFNCGFWKLLHTVTIGIAEHRGGNALIEEGSLREGAQVFSPASAADTIRDYMQYFFLCMKCGNHFVQQYNDCSNLDRCLRLSDDETTTAQSDWKELAKWLWEFHNSVSVRVQNEKAAMKRQAAASAGPGQASVQDRIAVLWPKMDSCMRCYGLDGTWDEEAVFLHMEVEYWPASKPDPKTDRLLRLEQETDPTGSGLFVVLVLLCIVLIFVMRHSISPKSVQRALLAAKSVRAGAGMSGKRSD